MKRLVLGLMAGLAVTAQAHFRFVVPGAGGRTAQVFLGEELKPETGIEPTLITFAKRVMSGSDGPALQGMHLAANGEQICRIGGLSPRNALGQRADNYSGAECARFEPMKGKWAAVPPLPEPQSSRDVAVAGVW